MSNAVKAQSWAKHFSFAFTEHGGPPVIMHHEIASGQTIEKGMPLVLADDKVSEGATNSPLLYGMANAPGVAGDFIPVLVGDRGTIFVGQMDADPSALHYPMECDIVEQSTVWKVDVGGSVEDVLLLLMPVPGDDLTDTTDVARVYFKIKRSSYDQLVAATT